MNNQGDLRKERMNQIELSLKKAHDEWTRQDAKRRLLIEQMKKKEQSVLEYKETIETYEKARLLLQQSAEYAREQAKQQMETLVTNALQYVFGPLFSFQIEIEEQGNKAVAEFYVVSDYEGIKVKTKPQDARGGGVVDIVTLALRVALMETIQPKVEGPLLLDEPGKHVSGEYVYYLYEFLKSLSTMFGRQIIMITHNQHLAESGDLAYQVSIQDGISEVIRIDNT
ncbi:chromosomal segregation ATPase [Alkalihalophilus pseudofirmus OF4]|jgi:DNA repair ATPase RecN|uniref:Chromosomal segregation ATPase n=3 Tax=Alkalihalophilus TaxID=2893060 RepID=D3FTX0_ALKPO|nr:MULTISPECIES: ATPase [Alkalihalophilus]ADC51951.1 chromosomal segregation ATPase [Alkalihalophilus pseudofirmus OF4]ERN53350.1 ATPase [Alkalihalophilus marmarensis DSM 21297]MCM3489506.1 ATP-binding protein [Alkalihalophilus marmarensis]MDV2885199.1 ATP-binding protein [Alkalihalophilus pseudofirmus]MED1602363.1 ATP-binding protein [Alkalihalophilus marmarensis]